MRSGGSSISSAPLAPQPLGVPGGGAATLGSAPARRRPPAADAGSRTPPSIRATAGYRPPETLGARPQPQLRRTGPRPVPNYSTPQPLVTLGATNLTYGDSRYWQVTVTHHLQHDAHAINTQAECTFMNAGRPVATDYLGPRHDPARRADHHRADRPADHGLRRFAPTASIVSP